MIHELAFSFAVTVAIVLFCAVVMGGFAILIFEFGWFSAIPIAVFMFVWFTVYKILTEE